MTDFSSSPLVVQREGWTADAACRGLDPNLFFPERGEPTRTALAVCAGCTVRAECLDYALRTNSHIGIWGGTTGTERRRPHLRAELTDARLEIDRMARLERVGRVARQALAEGRAPVLVVAAEFGVHYRSAANLIRSARTHGVDIPPLYNCQGAA